MAVDLARKAIYMIFVCLVLFFLFYYMGSMMDNYYAKTVIDSDRISSELIASNLLASPGCLAYYDPELGRTYLGVVDLGKFTVNLDACLPYNDRPFSLTIEGRTISFGLKDGVRTYTVRRPVLVRDGDRVFPSVMVLEDGYVR